MNCPPCKYSHQCKQGRCKDRMSPGEGFFACMLIALALWAAIAGVIALAVKMGGA